MWIVCELFGRLGEGEIFVGHKGIYTNVRTTLLRA